MINQPLGNFARSRRDWNIEQLRYGSASTNGSDDNLSDNYYLNNNANDGSLLAVWGILAWYNTAFNFMSAVPVNSIQGAPSNAQFSFPLMAQGQSTPGFVSFVHNSSIGNQNTALLFRADGINWLHNHDAPLFILPVGWSVNVFTTSNLGLLPLSTMSWCTFLWGPYASARLRPPSSSSAATASSTARAKSIRARQILG